MKHSSLQRLSPFLDAWLGYLTAQQLSESLEVTICLEGNVIYEYRSWQQPIHVSTVLRHNIGSQSKMLTAIMAMRLVELGSLELQQPMSTYLPWATQHPDKRFGGITVEQLLAHTSGLPREAVQSDFWVTDHPFPTSSWLHDICLATTIHQGPNIGVKYSNLGYALLGQIIEAATDTPYPRLADQLLIRPLQLAHTSAGLPPEPAAIMTGYGHFNKGQRIVFQQAKSPHTYTAVTGWYSTPADMATISNCLHNGQDDIVSAQTKQMLIHGQRGHWTVGSKAYGTYAYGVMKLDVGDYTMFGHAGAYFGHRSATFYEPDSRVAISAVANTVDFDVTDIVAQLCDMVRFFNTTEDANGLLNNFDGVYQNALSAKYICRVGGSIVCLPVSATHPLQSVDILQPLDAHTLSVTHSSHLGSQNDLVVFYPRRPDCAAHITYGNIPFWSVRDMPS